MLEKTPEGLLDSKEIKPVNPKGNQPWIGRTDSEAPILWPPDAKGPLLGKDSDAGKDWRQEEKGVTEDERVECHHRLKLHEFEQSLGNSDGQGGLACCSPWGPKASDMTGRLSNKQSDDSRPVGEGSWGTRNTLKTTKRPRRCPRGDQGESYGPTVGVDGETQARWPRKGRLRETSFCFLWQRGWWNNAEKEALQSDGGSWWACKRHAATLDSDLRNKWMMQITGATWRWASEGIIGWN